MKLWIVGKINPGNRLEWDFQGIFDDEDLARAECKDKNWFIGPVLLNESRLEDQYEWEGAYYPNWPISEMPKYLRVAQQMAVDYIEGKT